MKKELNALLTTDKNIVLKLNGAFTLEVNCANADGLNIALSKDKTVVERTITLNYTLVHDKSYLTYRRLMSTTVDGLMEETPLMMKDILSEIADRLTYQFKNGYLLGEIKEV